MQHVTVGKEEYFNKEKGVYTKHSMQKEIISQFLTGYMNL
jgi:hypothetical protein